MPAIPAFAVLLIHVNHFLKETFCFAEYYEMFL